MDTEALAPAPTPFFQKR